jgi:hypothetical protein
MVWFRPTLFLDQYTLPLNYILPSMPPVSEKTVRFICFVCFVRRAFQVRLYVIGLGVVGMTSRVGQGQSRLPADVPGISTALSQKDRLRPKDRLRQQPAGDSTEESQSRRRRQDPSNGCFAESSLAPTRSTEARDRRDTSHARSPPISGQKPSSRKDPRQKGEYMPPRCRSRGKGTL